MNVINVNGVDITYRHVYSIPLEEKDFNLDNIMATRLVVFKLEDVCKLIGVDNIHDVPNFVSLFWFDVILERYNYEKVVKGLESLRKCAAELV